MAGRCSGSCVLRRPELARVVADSLLFFDGQRVVVESFVVMPNHVHALFSVSGGYDLENVLNTWKTHTALEINKRLGQRGRFWQRDYWDRMIRSERHYYFTQEYIRDNPAKAKLRDGEFLYWRKPGAPPAGRL